MTSYRQNSGVFAVVLAAGASRRMGEAKQLLELGGKTILTQTLENVRASAVDGIVLVLGFAAESIEKSISTNGIKIVHNPEYQQGMGTSLRSGLAALNASAKAALIVLADQPFVRPETLDQLIACHQSSNPQIVIPVYKGFRGNPVLLDRTVFPELQALTGDVGCRAIFGNHTENICRLAVDDPGILLDIDSREEYEKLKSSTKDSPMHFSADALESRRNVLPGCAELVIAGRDPVALALVKLGRLLNFTVTLVDPLLPLAELPEADRVLHALDFSLLPPVNERFVVVASRGLFDEEAVEQALQTGSSYIALLANKKRGHEIMQSLRKKSFPEEKLAAVRVPAGLNIGAESPEEIALSIMAEIVAAKHRKEGPKREK